VPQCVFFCACTFPDTGSIFLNITLVYMLLFFDPQLNEHRSEVQLSEEESRHCIKVLRLNEGDNLHITNGKGLLAELRISRADARKCQARVVKCEYIPQVRPYSFHLAIAPTKNAERIEWMLEKCVEIGIDKISFIQCQNSAREFFNKERMEKKAIAAMKQSLGTWLPDLQGPMSFAELIASSSEVSRFIAYVDQRNPLSLWEACTPMADTLVLIGPEGDFSPEEINTALSAGFRGVSLGQSRLRTETAGLIACHTLLLKNAQASL
jgi:16S rRNA (uracil1498-N3)-methyltransferase